MGKHEFHDRPGDDEGDADPGQYPERAEPPDPGLTPDPLDETAAPASLAGIPAPPEYPDPTPAALPWIDDRKVDRPADRPYLGDRPYIADVSAADAMLSREPGVQPGTLLGVVTGPADPEAAALMTGLPVDTFTADGGPDVTARHDPGDPEQYAGEPVDDGFDDDPIERGVR